MSELRLFPRVQTALEVEVSNPLGETAKACVRNLSFGGLMLDGDLTFKELICDRLPQSDCNTPIEIRVRCTLPDEPKPFESRCRLVFVRRLSQNQFNFGFRFVDIGSEMSAILQRYVSGTLFSDTSERSQLA